MGKICIIKVGNVVAGAIEILTMGWGKDLAGWVAWKFFKTHDCKCESRRIFLNELFGCSDGIKL
jgi:hypothetical protein